MNENIHSVANFNPEEYEVLDYLDNKRPEYQMGCPIKAYEAIVKAWAEDIAAYFPTSACVTQYTGGEGPQLPEHNIHKCRHCGNGNVRWIAAVRHIPTKTNLVFGSDCVFHLQFPNKQAFKLAQIKARAEQHSARMKIYALRNELLSKRPELADALARLEGNPVHENNVFAHDIARKLEKYGTLSDRQIECFMQSLDRDVNRASQKASREIEKAALIASGVKAPSGRQTVEGIVLSTRKDETDEFGTVFKWLVQLTNGTKVWTTIPSPLVNNWPTLKGAKVRFAAKFEVSKDDPTFAFGKRPTKAEILK